jgi:hypothetical protein
VGYLVFSTGSTNRLIILLPALDISVPGAVNRGHLAAPDGRLQYVFQGIDVGATRGWTPLRPMSLIPTCRDMPSTSPTRRALSIAC